MTESRESRMESRRSLLKKIGAGGALVWAAPVVTSASPVGPLSACPAVDWNCGDLIVQCADPAPPVGIGICVCDIDVEGNPFCWNDAFCGDPGVVPCVTSGDCLPGWRCVTNCCGGSYCFPPCGTAPAVSTSGTRGTGL